ncbi:hypothetical protein N7465_005384 [Penicillium sp. CMV-2018d]|nr:hypothetical protein N7465_005384 [Penicillium sp. CMV-2018d]
MSVTTKRSRGRTGCRTCSQTVVIESGELNVTRRGLLVNAVILRDEPATGMSYTVPMSANKP